jgi:type IV pilus assembly protein PilY1
MNLLPHLQWLKAADYSHVYYVDGSAQAFDVNVFADDATHPGGWGTILVTGMRFGGGDFALDLDADNVAETIRTSAVIVMDITDPEKPPVLLGELTSPALNFTTGLPVVLKARRPDSTGSYATPAVNRWLLLLGSGPEDMATATSVVQKPTLVAWDLQTKTYINLSSNLQAPVMEPAGFYGSFTTRDINDDYVDDVVYVGTVEGTENAPAGRLKRLVLNESSDFGLAGAAQLSTVLDVERPIVAKPNVIHSYANNEDWLLFGTGRAFTFNDYRSVTAQRIFGIRETTGFDTSTLVMDSLLDSTDIVVQAEAETGFFHVWDAQVNQELIIDDARLGSFAELLQFMNTRNGWYKSLQADLQDPAERIVNAALLLRSTAIFTSYLPDPDASTNNGESFIHALNYQTGTADATGLLGIDEQHVLFGSTSAGHTELTEPVLNIREGSDPKLRENTASQPEDENDGTMSIMAGTEDGGTFNHDLQVPPSVPRRISWELLDMIFEDD